MDKKRKQFADDLDETAKSPANDGDLNQYHELADKWNDIQEAYIERYPELSMEDLYYEGGGFEGLIEKIAEVRGTTSEEIRNEIAAW